MSASATTPLLAAVRQLVVSPPKRRGLPRCFRHAFACLVAIAHHRGPILMIALLLSACAPAARHIDDPIAVMLDRERATAARIAAIQASSRSQDEAARLKALRQLVFSQMQPSGLRVAAARAWKDADARDYRQTMARRLRQINDAELLRHVSADAVAGQWTDLTPALVRSLANEHVEWSSLRDRPEYRALASLHAGQAVEAVLFDVFADERAASPAARSEAWQVLAALEGPDALRQRLATVASRSAWLDDLQHGLDDFGVLPTHAADVAWLLGLRSPEHARLWRAAKTSLAALDAEQRVGLAVRHIPLLARTSTPTFARPRTALAHALLQRDRAAEHSIKRQPEHIVQPVPDQHLEDWLDTLPWADCVALLEIHRLLGDSDLLEALFRQAEADRLDDRSEHGGLITFSAAQGYAARPYPPMLTRDDQAYIPPADLFVDLHTAVAHYHFHAQKHENAEAAAPGFGDLNLADRVGGLYLVFTFVTPDSLNADVYLRGRKSIDLGTLRRRTYE